MLNLKKVEISQKIFLAKNVLKQNNIFAIRGKRPSCFNCVRANNTHTIGVRKQLNKFLTVHIKPFSKEP